MSVTPPTPKKEEAAKTAIDLQIPKAQKPEQKTYITKTATGVLVENLINVLGAIFILVTWLLGIVLAQGWMKLVAIFPFYAWYLVVEFFFRLYYPISGG